AHEEGEKQNLIHILSLPAQAKRWVSLRWKWRVSSAWKSTFRHPQVEAGLRDMDIESDTMPTRKCG
ncbi:MAG: hypothetical protein LBV05_03320, partial [Comamonas sp.]|uniref:hypothetical protein n=1 Tax=Comamonas sp. TaxID=34028 RepID=UPI00283F31FE